MDRQTVLEQKRKRLEELRQRRLASTELRVELEPVPVESPPLRAPVATVDAGVQTEKFEPHQLPKITKFTEISTFDKAIQTVKKPDPIEQEPAVFSGEKTVENDQIFNEESLNELLKHAIVTLHQVISRKSTSKSPNNENKALYKLEELSTQRVPISMDFKDTLLLVNFSASSTDELQGFAIVYDVENGIVPLYFLGCVLPINVIKLDIFDSKAIGGLINGKVVVWEFDDTDAIIMPTLVSPSDYTSTKLHESPITSILQNSLEPYTFVSTCEGGMINSWSTNFLQYPKGDAVRIPSDTDERSLLRTESIIDAIMLKTHKLKEFSIIDVMMISTGAKTLNKLTNDPKLGYISSKIDTKYLGSLNVIGYKDDAPIIACTAYDNNIYIYNIHKEILLLKTNYIALGVSVRPQHDFQFVSYGLFDELQGHLSTVVDYWDLSVDTTSPVFSFSNESPDHPVTSLFDETGNLLYIGFSDCKIWKFALDTTGTVITNKSTIHDII